MPTTEPVATAEEPRFADPRARRVGKRIRTRRKALGLTQAVIAAAAGITQGHLSQIERGDRLPTVATIQKLRTPLQLDDRALAELIEASA